MATKYVLVPAGATALQNVDEVAKKTGRPAPSGLLTLSTADATKCGAKDDGLGGSIPDTRYSAQVTGAWLQVVNKADFRQDRSQDVYFSDGAPANGSNATTFAVLEGGAPCAVNINGVDTFFKKYSCDVT